ncbi:MAG: alpha/beta hydrolase fold domain-containing protein [Acidobacteriota bacterium]|nr:alpha/beta hydrolase [Blastocatellia bacterium]MDW8413532.1 alpha/beta hydrolase fold domain-containing protein [Acidobacteriota bacterium]
MRRFLLFILLSATVYGQKVTRDVPYGAVSATRGPLTLDVYEPLEPSTTLRPLVIYVHGGGFSSGDKSQGQTKARPYTDAGFVFASVSYRLSGEAPFPAAPIDILTAVRYFRANASTWKIDPTRIGLYGTSAGATLAVFAAVASNTGKYDVGAWSDQSSKVGAAAGYFGPMDFVNVPLTSAEIAYLGGSPQEKPDVAREASPVFNVDAEDPPIILFHGDNDSVVPVEHSERMYQALQEVGVPSSFTKVRNAGHNFMPTPPGSTVVPSPQEIEQQTIDFFKKYLVEQVPDITPPRVTDVVVNGGREVLAGSTISITWTSTDNVGVASHEVWLSTDAGVNFEVIAKGLAGTIQSFSWSVPAQLQAQSAVIGVLARDIAGNRRLGVSPPFVIKPSSSSDSTPPKVANVKLSAERIIAGQSYTISWVSSDDVGVARHDILLSLDGGTNFDRSLASGLAGNINSFAWNVAENLTAESAVVAVQAIDSSGNKGIGTSAAFRIEAAQRDTNPPVVSAVSVANGASKVKRGATVSVRWQATDDRGVSSQRILLSLDGGTTFPVTIAEGLGGSISSFDWAVSTSLSKAKAAVVKVEAVDQAGNKGSSMSSAFRIK